MGDCFIVRRGGGGGSGETIDFVQYVETLAEGFMGREIEGYLNLRSPDNSWNSLIIFDGYTPFEIGIQGTTLNRADGFVASTIVAKNGDIYYMTADASDSIFKYPSANGFCSYFDSFRSDTVCTTNIADINLSPAISRVWSTTDEFKIPVPLSVKFKDLYTLTNTEGVTGVFILLWSGQIQCLFMVNGCFPVFNYTTGKIIYRYDAGETYKFLWLDQYPIDGYVCAPQGRILNSASTATSVSFDPGYDLSNVFFNSEDILDEHGNVVVPKNCDLSDFI